MLLSFTVEKAYSISFIALLVSSNGELSIWVSFTLYFKILVVKVDINFASLHKFDIYLVICIDFLSVSLDTLKIDTLHRC